MPRPLPLTILVNGEPTGAEYQALTPRTPHSRASHANTPRTSIELRPMDHDDDDDELAHAGSQRAPLLGNPSYGDIQYRDNPQFSSHSSRAWRRRWARSVISYAPLWGGLSLAAALLFLVLSSLTRPKVLDATSQAIPASAVNQTKPNVSNPHGVHHTDGNFISYENYTHFPLSPTEYRNECATMFAKWMHGHGDYWTPMHGMPADVPHPDSVDEGVHYPVAEDEPTAVCSSSITYMLDGHVGLMADLALMAQVAALARERNRTFFVDDTYWNRGKWTDHFQQVQSRQPGPEPNCRPPPPEELVACPRTARHWIVNSRTAKWHLGHPFSEQYQDPYAKSLNRMKPMFQHAFHSFAETIRPNAKNAALIRSARSELANIVDRELQEPYLAVHIRRGDRRGSSWAYHNSYLPISLYTDAVQETWDRFHQEASLGAKGQMQTVYIASDTIAAQTEFAEAVDPSRIFSLARSSNPELRDIASEVGYEQKKFSGLPLDDRVRLTRGMITDFALMSGMWAWEAEIKPSAVICGISSNVCRMAAVGFGWQGAFGLEGGDHEDGSMDNGRKRWVEIDNAGAIVPQWDAFELF
ncbi:hypothetical protein PUNSTDRAFT_49178 [Punctularia strigosozonata HHB-11173 SS5]|uniref:uncharacterized protein n=1 Tax=Punctularia strigosozonata (strain HHB-11173) TaxID=741275 RepID=UPI0004416333|nr:uncharacterized protein PUNSTDRAFT_49178 [Punctularia strigosozonata HHB-11173 SS5]EIN14358.1 hypothetical protein PUNSTDRAFT_49178 [Punctularia strigosozonata HHB-11173 SS5]